MDENLGLVLLCTAHVDNFYVWFFEFSLGSFGVLSKISDVKIFKRLSPTVSSNFNQLYDGQKYLKMNYLIGDHIQYYLIILALPDYVSRAHEIEIRLSSVPPSMLQLYLFLMHGFLSSFGCCFPWAIPSDLFWIFEKKTDFLRIFFVFVNMDAISWQQKFQNATPPTNRSWTFSNFSWIVSS